MVVLGGRGKGWQKANNILLSPLDRADRDTAVQRKHSQGNILKTARKISYGKATTFASLLLNGGEKTHRMYQGWICMLDMEGRAITKPEIISR